MIVVVAVDVAQDLEDKEALEEQVGHVDEHEALLALSVSVTLIGVFQSRVLQFPREGREVNAFVDDAAPKKRIIVNLTYLALS